MRRYFKAAFHLLKVFAHHSGLGDKLLPVEVPMEASGPPRSAVCILDPLLK